MGGDSVGEKIQPTFDDNFPVLTLKKEQSKSTDDLKTEKTEALDGKAPNYGVAELVQNDGANE